VVFYCNKIQPFFQKQNTQQSEQRLIAETLELHAGISLRYEAIRSRRRCLLWNLSVITHSKENQTKTTKKEVTVV